MDNKKFEKLIDLIINENEEQARALFHDIVVEKSRQIYEGLMDEEMGMDQSMGMLDELSAQNDAEEQGAFEADEEFDDIEVGDDGMGDEEVDLDSDEFGDEEGEEGLEDRVVDLEDKLDQLMAEFEEIMGQEGEEGGEDFGDEEGDEDMGGEDDMMESKEEDEEELDEAKEEDDEEESLEEAIQLKKVSVTHGDNGVNTKSIVSGGPKVSGNGASASNLNKGYQDSGKGGTQGGVLNPATKDIKHAGAYGNSPNSFKFKEKGEAAPKAKHGDDGQNTKSIVGEGKKSVKKPVAKTTTKKIVK
jgi:hypothetical protein